MFVLELMRVFLLSSWASLVGLYFVYRRYFSIYSTVLVNFARVQKFDQTNLLSPFYVLTNVAFVLGG